MLALSAVPARSLPALLALFCSLLAAGCGGASRAPAEPAVSGETTLTPPASRVSPSWPAADDPDRPTGPRYQLSSKIRPLAYRLHLEVDPAAATFAGEVEIDLASIEPVSHLWLHSLSLAIDVAEIEAGGKRWTPRVDLVPPLVRLDLGSPALFGKLLVRLRYRGVTTADEQGLFTRRDAAGRAYLYSQAQTEYARRITPCFDEPRHKVPWQVSVTAPAGALVVGNGVALRDARLADGRHRVDFAATRPMASYLLAVAAGPFAAVELGPLGRGRCPTRLIVPSGGQAGAAIAAATLPRVVAALERWLELALPLDKLDVVAVPQFFGAMENPGLVTVNADDMLTDPATRPEAQAALRVAFARVMLHELTHQWFGDLVTPASWDDLWISEGLATWVSQRAFPELPELDPVLARVSSMLAARQADARAPVSVRRDLGQVDSLFDVITYDKSGALLSMIARWMGEPRFTAALRDLLVEHRDGAVTTAALAAALGRVAPEAESMLWSALVVPHPPLVELTLRCDAWPKLLARVSENIGALPVCIRYEAPGGAHSVCKVLSGPGSFALPRDHCPAWMVGNDDLRGYYRVRWSVATPWLQPPPALQTRAERLGTLWELALDVEHTGWLPQGAIDELVARSGGRGSAGGDRGAVKAGKAAGSSLEQDLADLQLLAALEQVARDDELPAWRALLERRAVRMLRPGSGGELARARTTSMLGVLVDVPWPAALTEPALAAARRWQREQLAGPGGAALGAEEAERSWQLAIRSQRPEVIAELLAAAASPSATAASPLAAPTPAQRALRSLPASALPALLAALDGGALPWPVAAPALAAYLQRRSSQGQALIALADRRAAMEQQLGAAGAMPLVDAAGALCSPATARLVRRVFRALADQLPEGAGKLDEAAARIERCDDRRPWRKGLRGVGIQLPPP